MSHALLLRLFLSPYFSISVAMHYLKTYSDSIGISHYLCWRMRGMSTEEVESYWPQICHLLITYPTKSNALESFIIQRAEESTHSAMLTFWFMQAALRDLTPTRQTNPRPFLICQRILHRCHEIIFGDVPEPGSRSPYRSLPASPHPISRNGLAITDDKDKRNIKVNPHALPALVGMGAIAMAAGMPALRETVGEWAIMQGRQPRDEDGQGRERVEGAEGASEPKGRRLEQARKAIKASEEKVDLNETSEDERVVDSPEKQKRQGGPLAGTPRTGQTRHTVPSPRSHPSQTAPDLSTPPNMSLENLPLHTPLLDTPPADTDPFSVEEPLPVDTSTPVSHASRVGSSARRAHYHSFPDLSHLTNPERPASANGRRGEYGRDQSIPAEVLLANYSMDKQRQLLKSHYTRSEIRFLLVLENISNRLLVVPKPARVPALRAELTSLNHNLPAEVCMPLWCSADHAHDSAPIASSNGPLSPALHRRSSSFNAKKKGHSRVVRISPGDSVVLNSAERAPFLLHVEILEGDLDFDPTRRENRELLKKIVIQEDNKRRKKELGHAVGAGGSDLFTRFGGESTVRRNPGLGLEGFGSPMPEAPKPRTPVKPARAQKRMDIPPIEVEEVDLVEQMYGARVSVRDTLPELTDSLPLPSGPQNKATDAAAWSRAPPSAGPSRRTSFSPPHSAALGDAAGVLGGESPRMEQNANGLMPAAIPAATALPAQAHTVTSQDGTKKVITLEDYSERMRTAAVMLAQLNASLVPAPTENTGGRLSWLPGTGWITGSSAAPSQGGSPNPNMPSTPGLGPGGAADPTGAGGKLRLAAAQAEAIRSRIMEEMMALEEERVERMTERPAGDVVLQMSGADGQGDAAGGETAEDEGIVRRELNKADPSAAVFKESWAAKKSRIRSASPWGHLANWDVISVIVKTGTDLRQEQLATQLIERFSRIFREEKCECWVRFFRILITGEQSGLVETITDAVSVHSIKKGEYARRLAEGGPMGRVSLMDHFVSTYGKPDSGRFARAQRAFIRSLAGYSVVTYLLQIKDRHNGNILVDRDGHLIHIDFGFMLSNSPGGNMGFEAAPFKFPLEYVEILGGLDSHGWKEFKRLFKEGFEAARKHSDSLITMVELMQKDSKLDCFILFGDQTAHHFRERFALGLTTAAVDAHLERLIVSSMGSNYTRLYDTFQYYSQGVL